MKWKGEKIVIIYLNHWNMSQLSYINTCRQMDYLFRVGHNTELKSGL